MGDVGKFIILALVGGWGLGERNHIRLSLLTGCGHRMNVKKISVSRSRSRPRGENLIPRRSINISKPLCYPRRSTHTMIQTALETKQV